MAINAAIVATTLVVKRKTFSTLEGHLTLQQLEPLPQGVCESLRQSFNAVQQNVEGERVLFQVAREHQVAAHVASLARLQYGRVSFLVHDWKTEEEGQFKGQGNNVL